MPEPQTPWQQNPQIRSHQRRAVLVLFIAQALGGLAIGAGTSMGSLVAYEVTADESMAGIVRIASALGVALFATPMAWLAVQRGRRAALTGGWALALLGGLVLLLALGTHHLGLLVLGTLVFSAGSAANLQMRFAATDMELPARRGRTLSTVVWAATIGSVASPMLAGPGAVLARRLRLPDIAGVFVFSVAGLVVACLFIATMLRPDPMRVAQRHGENPRAGRAAAEGRLLLRLWKLPLARLALVTAALNQAVMTAVMVLTPVHMAHGGHGLAAVGATLSLHILGMFAFSPLVGWISDRHLGEARTILLGVATHLGALSCCFLGSDSMLVLVLGLFLLGLGWSFASVASASLLVTAVPGDIRAPAQGTFDMVANLGAALAAGVAGPVMAGWEYEGLSLVSALCLVPIAVLAVAAPPQQHRQ